MLVESWQMSGKLYKMSHWISALCHVGITQGLQTQETNKDKKNGKLDWKDFSLKLSPTRFSDITWIQNPITTLFWNQWSINKCKKNKSQVWRIFLGTWNHQTQTQIHQNNSNLMFYFKNHFVWFDLVFSEMQIMSEISRDIPSYSDIHVYEGLQHHILIYLYIKGCTTTYMFYSMSHTSLLQYDW